MPSKFCAREVNKPAALEAAEALFQQNRFPEVCSRKGKLPGRYSVPFNQAHLTGRELTYLAQAVANRNISGDGFFTEQVSRWIETYLGCSKVLLTTSCTHALELAGLLLNLQPGDEVIVPSFTFVSTANAFALRGAVPVFVDIRPDTLNMDEALLPERITSRTRAIVPVHYAGIACHMRAILSIAEKHGIAVIEDNAHGLFGTLDQKPLGSFGQMASLSFHETKNITCGEGGALVLNDPAWIEKAEIIREKGTNRSAYFRGQAGCYTWKEIGSSYLPSELLAAFLYAQFEQAREIQQRREWIWKYYETHLQDWAARRGVQLPHVPEACAPAWHIFYMLMPDSRERDGLIRHLEKHGIKAVFHYLPLHSSEKGKTYAAGQQPCPVAEDCARRLIRLPLYVDLTEQNLDMIIQRIRQF